MKDTISLCEIAISSVDLEKSIDIDLPNAIVSTNLAELDPSFAMHMQEYVYKERKARLSAISLVGLPRGTTVFGGGHFITSVNDRFITEQYPPYIGTLIPDISEVTEATRETVNVEGEKLLIGRFGISTWGHWLGEMLPKVVLAEKCFPGRFSYVLPAYITDGSHPKSIWSSIADSLETCGIRKNRMFSTDSHLNYVFKSLFAVTSLWSDYIMHPRASEALRLRLSSIPPASDQKIAIIRDVQFERTLENASEIYDLLQTHGFTAKATGSLSFIDQVSAFKGAKSVFGVLGSDLSNLLFSPAAVDVVAVAPDVFGDRFFYALVLDREGRMADLRGPVVEVREIMHRSKFVIDVKTLEAALLLMGL